MERTPQQISNSISMGYAVQESSGLKLPLAPILSTPDRIRTNPTIPLRRGSSIFSPSQTLDPPFLHPPPPDPDPPPSSTADASDSGIPPPPQPPSAAGIKYRECLKNHAAAMGGHVVDGCGEFMPSGEDGTPESLRCAACDCHRNFHRKEADGHNTVAAQHIHGGGQITYSMAPPHLRHRHKHHGVSASAPPAVVNFGAESSSEDLNMFHSGGGASKKRYRTKFSQNQKDRMEEFASKLGWRFQKEREEEVQRFCGEVGVQRQVFKVWMHNNKQAMKRRQI